MGALKNWTTLQEQYDCYYFVADWHALTTDYADPSDVAQNALEVAADCIASGLDPERSVIFLQSMVPAHAELHLLFSMFTPLGWLERVPTYKDQIRQLENKDLATYGFLGYPVLQAADILVYRGDMVPVGEDQASHLELSRELARRFNSYYGDTLPEPRALFTPAAKVPGLDGRKMSKSYGNTINIADTPDEIRAKCKSMFTDPTRIRRDDPGHPETCNLYQFHRLVSPPELQKRVADECRRAQIGCVDDKALVADQLIAFLEPMRRRREELIGDPGGLLQLLREGSARAAERAEATLDRVRQAMRLDYDRFGRKGKG
jgi:tryptophanyl-tRNA synthetase